MNITPINKYFIVSLPRTGTKSLCKMTKMLGFNVKHVPSSMLPILLRDNIINVFADTPIFAPSFFKSLVNDENNKFIYIDKSADSWVKSFEKVGLHRNYMALLTNVDKNYVNKLDDACLKEVFSNLPYSTELAITGYHIHKNTVYESIPSNRLLTYTFDMGWKPLCNFMEIESIPTEAIPHLNVDTMFDVI